MALILGSKLGSYEVLSLLGAGGMGEVYRARDTRLGREVAIKVLPVDRMADENRRQRFVREARAASALNHPNIVTIYEIESADGIDFIVMEYIPGKNLEALIPRQGMRIPEVLRIAMPMADALARAHARGIIHRDLKPANVVVSNDGVVKVLDFGLAKLVYAEERASDDQETATRDTTASLLSHPGIIAGTAGYMSPEQATARTVDSRSDVFAFGSVLYEMVTGRRAFAGNSTAETLAAVVKEQPKAPSVAVPSVPRDLEKVILRCLQKDPDRRFQHMLDVKVELNEIKEESDSQPAAAAAPARADRRSWFAGLVAATALLTTVVWLGWRPRKTEVAAPRLEPLTSLRGLERHPTFSPDGGQIAFAWEGETGDNSDIYLKLVGSSEIRRVTSDPSLDAAPSWSPDGRQIAFLRFQPGGPARLGRLPFFPSTIHLISPVGGSDRRLSDFPARDSQLSWSPDGRFLAAARFASATEKDPRASGIYLIPVAGGEPRALTSPSPPTFHTQPALSWDGRHLAYASCLMFLSCQVDVVELDRDYVPMGPPRRLTRRPGYIRGLAWTRDGSSLIYDGTAGRLWRVSLVEDRPPEKIELAGLGPLQPATVAALDRLAFAQDRRNNDIYRFEVGHAPEALLVSSAHEGGPQVSPDGLRIAFESGRGGDGLEIWLAAADGSNATQLTRGPGISQGSPSWAPNGQRIAFDSQGEDGHWDIWTIDAEGVSPRRLTADPGDENMPSWSRDGRFIYFQSNRAGTPEDIWRIPVAGGSAERVTRGGGTLAFESADGTTLFFMRALANTPLMALPLGGGPERKILECVPPFRSFAVGSGGVYHFACDAGPSGAPLLLLDPATGRDRLLGTLGAAGGVGGLSVSPDGRTILYSKRVGEGSDLMMIENFR